MNLLLTIRCCFMCLAVRLIVATKLYPTPIVCRLLDFVKPSRPIVVFSPYKEVCVLYWLQCMVVSGSGHCFSSCSNSESLFRLVQNDDYLTFLHKLWQNICPKPICFYWTVIFSDHNVQSINLSHFLRQESQL